MIRLRAYNEKDLDAVLTLFYETVHTVNACDYTPAQCDAWAPKLANREAWRERLNGLLAFVAVTETGALAGFGTLDPSSGLLDHLYVHKDRQHQGIATALCEALEDAVTTSVITTYASLTAEPFFAARGYYVVEWQQVVRNGVVLANAHMEKRVLAL